jgi:hypothetical protein
MMVKQWGRCVRRMDLNKDLPSTSEDCVPGFPGMKDTNSLRIGFTISVRVNRS